MGESIPNLDEHARECYFKAGKAVADALKLGQAIARPGTKLLDLANLVEDTIKKHDVGLSFPVNLSLDECAAHYSPIIGDELTLPKIGLLKIDAGSQCDGYVADAAVTINLGKDKGILETLVKASRDALYASIKNFKVGVNVSTIGRIIQTEIEKYEGCKPISNLGGHQLKQWNLHAGIFVPNIGRSTDNYVLKEGDQFAIEPFATNGYGAIRNGPKMTIFRYKGMKKKKNLPMTKKLQLQNFKKEFKSLPFSPRWINFIPKDQINATVLKYFKQGALEGYHTFIERAKGMVSQAEHTVIVTKEGGIPTTWWEDFDPWD
jgi:methionyl aminopeptidase